MKKIKIKKANLSGITLSDGNIFESDSNIIAFMVYIFFSEKSKIRSRIHTNCNITKTGWYDSVNITEGLRLIFKTNYEKLINHKEFVNFLKKEVIIISSENLYMIISDSKNFTETIWIIDNKKVGYGNFLKKINNSTTNYNWYTEIQDEYIGLGLGFKFYNLMDEYLREKGFILVPSKYLTSAARGVWRKINPELVKFYKFDEKTKYYKI